MGKKRNGQYTRIINQIEKMIRRAEQAAVEAGVQDRIFCANYQAGVVEGLRMASCLIPRQGKRKARP